MSYFHGFVLLVLIDETNTATTVSFLSVDFSRDTYTYIYVSDNRPQQKPLNDNNERKEV